MTDKVVVITGATSGIGYALANALLNKGVAVIGVGRSDSLCRLVEGEFRDRYPGVRVRYSIADLSLQSQIRQLASTVENILEAWGLRTLDGLVNNAATVTFWRRKTSEGIEMQWAVNHVAPYMLSLLLMPLLQRAPKAKIITVSSGSHHNTDMRWDDLQFARRYHPMKVYKQSKLANILFTGELRLRLGPGSSVQAFAANPGLVKTDIGMKTGLGVAGWFWALWRRRGISPEESADGLMRLLEDESIEQGGEIYWKHGIPLQPDRRALDQEAGRRLWEITAAICGIDFP